MHQQEVQGAISPEVERVVQGELIIESGDQLEGWNEVSPKGAAVVVDAMNGDAASAEESEAEREARLLEEKAEAARALQAKKEAAKERKRIAAQKKAEKKKARADAKREAREAREIQAQMEARLAASRQQQESADREAKAMIH